MRTAHKVLAIIWFILGSFLGLTLTYMMHQRFDLGNTLFWTVPLILGPQIGIFVGEAKQKNPFWIAICGFLIAIIIIIAILVVALWLSASEKIVS